MIELSAPKDTITTSIILSGSKSISNRLLILNEVLGLNAAFKNLSDSEDTQLLRKALHQIKERKSTVIDIGHAGTDMRFLTAFLSVTEGEWVLTGSDRMKQRPIGELVKALKILGANIQFLEKEDFPPLKITGKKLVGGSIEIDSSVSSQFISALLLIAPAFEKGLQLRLKGETVSFPYIKMTVSLLKEFGIEATQNSHTIKIDPTLDLVHNENKNSVIESDWSSASYWYSICALSRGAQIELKYLNQKSTQGDSILPELYKPLGVTTTFKEGSVFLTQTKAEAISFEYDFTECPDLAQTLAVTCFGLGIKATLTGLKTLKIKESDRIIALKTELEKFGSKVEVMGDSIRISESRHKKPEAPIIIDTYNDHRMAMSFAPLSLCYKALKIRSPEVVDKSYPSFWEHLKSVGFSVNLQL